MYYQNLNELILKSSSSKQYFYSLPSKTQEQLREQTRYIHTLAQLHQQAESALLLQRQREIRNLPLF